MPVGDTVSYGVDDVANNGNTDIRPDAGVEVLIQSIEIQIAKTADVKRTSDGTNFTTIMQLTGGLVSVPPLRATNTYWLRITNTSGGAAGNYAAGVQTK